MMQWLTLLKCARFTLPGIKYPKMIHNKAYPKLLLLLVYTNTFEHTHKHTHRQFQKEKTKMKMSREKCIESNTIYIILEKI